MRKLISLISAFVMLFCATEIYAQNITVTGRVIDKSGEPLIAVTVFEDGNTANGTMTDIDGNYT